jgi:thiamine monophosphate synthase
MRFDGPINQVKLAERTGLSAVHVNRSLQILRARGAIHDDKKVVTIPSVKLLAEIAGLNPDYLLAELRRQ